MTIKKRVENGAAWLDKVRPGWEFKINLDILDISNGNVCICGQIFGGYLNDEHNAVSPGSEGWGADYGFNGDTETDLRRLAKEWSRVITARRGELSSIQVEAIQPTLVRQKSSPQTRTQNA